MESNIFYYIFPTVFLRDLRCFTTKVLFTRFSFSLNEKGLFEGLPFNYEEPAVKEFENLRKNNTVVDPGQIESKYAGTIKLLELDGKERWEKDSFTINNNIL